MSWKFVVAIVFWLFNRLCVRFGSFIAKSRFHPLPFFYFSKVLFVSYPVYHSSYPSLNYRTTPFSLIKKPHCKTVFSENSSKLSIHSDLLQTFLSTLP